MKELKGWEGWKTEEDKENILRNIVRCVVTHGGDSYSECARMIIKELVKENICKYGE
ncbi:MAG TPA: hypothetical protein VEF53_18740 [Patescibacteria group bacterium]|nr:hypothetical protein [Patescibacteria group bacterium]